MSRRVPAATYRLQLTPAFGFAAARSALPYLRSLGVTDLYLSPILAARRGGHGYDVTDPTRLNPELGSPHELEALAAEAAASGMGILLDIVPNHMSATMENPWWRDVLALGRASAFAQWFDVWWDVPGLEGRVLLPVLSEPFGAALAAGSLSVALGPDGFVVRTPNLEVPVWPGSYRLLLDGDAAPSELRRVAELARRLPADAASVKGPSAAMARTILAVRRELAAALEGSERARAYVGATLRLVRGVRGRRRTFDHLEAILGRQAYRLAWWREASRDINYRRFFDVSDLVAVRAEDPEVFDATHELILLLAGRGLVTGLRVDHVDGLRDPQAYLATLRGRLPDAFVVVEKILAPDERLPDWPVDGTTGYGFADLVTGVLSDGSGLAGLERITSRFTGSEPPPFDVTAVAAKREVIGGLFGGEVARLRRLLRTVAALDRRGRDVTDDDLSAAIVELTAALPVYRTYVRGLPIRPADRQAIDRAAGAASEAAPALSAAIAFMRRVLLLAVPSPGGSPPRWPACLPFVLAWQQWTGAATAKGVEDTSLYRRVVLLSMHEVGGDPGRPPVTPAGFHRAMLDRRRRLPRDLSATSTHDTKRGEDVRARIAVLSEIPDRWGEHVERWVWWNARHRLSVGGRSAPSRTEELYLYQTLLGTWPAPGAPADPEKGDLRRRLDDHMRKALREAKVHTDWLEPNETYEVTVRSFVGAVVGRLTGPGRDPFRRDFGALLRVVAFHGALNSLAQVVLKVAAPGIPDVYQGTELWNLRLTDPDNRFNVDLGRRASALEDLDRRAGSDLPGLIERLVPGWSDGRLKLFVLSRALRFRAADPELLERGVYLPLEVDGPHGDLVIAFARRHRERWAVAMVPRLTTRLTEPERFPLGSQAWRTARVRLPDGAPGAWTDVLTGRRVEALRRRRDGAQRLRLADAFASLPVALLRGGDGP